MLKKIALLIFVIAFIEGCKKYPEDKNLFHLETAKMRLCGGTWSFDSWEVLHSYPISTPGPDFYELSTTFSKSGNCAGDGGMGRCGNFDGTWEFTNNKNSIRITHNPAWITIWNIKRLDRKYMVICSDSLQFGLKR
jgi:hypothetical protein